MAKLMKRLLLCLMLILPVVTVYGASTKYFVTKVQVSNYWRTTQTTPVEEQATFIPGEDELFISGEDEPTLVEIEELLIDEQDGFEEEQAEQSEDENNHAEQSAGVIITPDEIEEQPTPAELEDIEEQEELTTDVEIEGES